MRTRVLTSFWQQAWSLLALNPRPALARVQALVDPASAISSLTPGAGEILLSVVPVQDVA